MLELSRNRFFVWGLALAVIPVLLSYPAIAFLAVCPPSYGPMLMTIVAIAFCVSWGVAIVMLAKARPLYINNLAAMIILWGGIVISISGSVFTTWLLAKGPTR